MELYKHALTTVLEDLIIIGAGGLGREVAAMVKSSFSDVYRVMGYVDDSVAEGTLIGGNKVLGNIDWLNNYNNEVSIVMAIGSPSKSNKELINLM